MNLYIHMIFFQLSQKLEELKISDHKINGKDLEIGAKIGRGAFADVFR